MERTFGKGHEHQVPSPLVGEGQDEGYVGIFAINGNDGEGWMKDFRRYMKMVIREALMAPSPRPSPPEKKGARV